MTSFQNKKRKISINTPELIFRLRSFRTLLLETICDPKAYKEPPAIVCPIIPQFFEEEWFKWPTRKVVEYFNKNRRELTSCLRFIDLGKLSGVYNEYFGDYKKDLRNRQNLETSLSAWYFFEGKVEETKNGGKPNITGICLLGFDIPYYLISNVLEYLDVDHRVLSGFGFASKKAHEIVLMNWTQVRVYTSNVRWIPKKALLGARVVRICEKMPASDSKYLWGVLENSFRFRRLEFGNRLTIHSVKVSLQFLSSLLKSKLGKTMNQVQEINFNYNQKTKSKTGKFEWGVKMIDVFPNLVRVENPHDLNIIDGLKKVKALHLKPLNSEDMKKNFTVAQLQKNQWSLDELSFSMIKGRVHYHDVCNVLKLYQQIRSLFIDGCEISYVKIPETVQSLAIGGDSTGVSIGRNLKEIRFNDSFPVYYVVDRILSSNNLKKVAFYIEKSFTNTQAFFKKAVKCANLEMIEFSLSNSRYNEKRRFSRSIIQFNKKLKILELKCIYENFEARDRWEMFKSYPPKFVDEGKATGPGKSFKKLVSVMISESKKKNVLDRIILNDNYFGAELINTITSQGFNQVPSSIEKIFAARRPRNELMRCPHYDKVDTWWTRSIFVKQSRFW